MARRLNQKQMVLDYIKMFGSITPIEAFQNLWITKLATVVSNLIRNDGVEIKKERDSATNRFGRRVSFERYSFPEKGEQKQ